MPFLLSVVTSWRATQSSPFHRTNFHNFKVFTTALVQDHQQEERREHALEKMMVVVIMGTASPVTTHEATNSAGYCTRTEKMIPRSCAPLCTYWPTGYLRQAKDAQKKDTGRRDVAESR
jgi:hypothetical protein